MRKMIKCAVSLLLCLVMTVGLLPVAALADDGDGVAINATNFPDPAFQQYVRENCDNDGSGVLSRQECEDVWFIFADGLGISTLKGIENFTKLMFLSCIDNKLTSLDLSENTLLEDVLCFCNRLTSLDISQNTVLKNLNCEENNLAALNTANNTELTKLSCSGNPIRDLDIRNNPKLAAAVTSGTKTYNYTFRGDALDVYVTYELKAQDYSFQVPSTTRVRTGSAEPPAVASQPQNVSTGIGKKATFSVTATGSGLKYQWYVCCMDTEDEWEKIQGATGAKLTVTVKNDDMDEAKYFCEISNGGGIVCTKDARISVISKPRITSQPANKTVKVGKTAAFKVKAKGKLLKYQWYYQKPNAKKWVKVKNGTAATLKVKAKKSMNGYKYRCKVYNAAGSVYSKTVKLKVKK